MAIPKTKLADVKEAVKEQELKHGRGNVLIVSSTEIKQLESKIERYKAQGWGTTNICQTEDNIFRAIIWKL